MAHATLAGLLQENPVISSVKSYDGLEKCLLSDSNIVFVLFGDILSVVGIIDKIKESEKKAFVHIDLIEGLAPKEVSVEYIKRETKVDGVISTKSNILRYAKNLSLQTVQRFFVLDSISLLNIEKQMPFEYADAIEILPGAMPKIINKVSKLTRKPIIASGLISEKEDIIKALNSGATSVSSSGSDIWFL